jgi:N utilization substance protein A
LDTIFQSIEILSKEKGIDPQIVLDAVKDAMLIAARKHYRTNEDYVADMDPKTGANKLYAVKKAVEEVEDPAHEMTMARRGGSIPKWKSAAKCASLRTPTPWGASPPRPPNR